MASTTISDIRGSLRELYLADPRPGLVGFSGGKDSTLVAPLVLDAVMSIPPEQAFWVNIIGRGYPPPNRIFRWCMQRLKIDPVTNFVPQCPPNGRRGEAILRPGARRAESSPGVQTMAGREARNPASFRSHPNLPRVWVSNPIQFLIHGNSGCPNAHRTESNPE